MAVKIKLKRVGKIHRPVYRVVVADARTKRDGRAIEEIGMYDPLPNPSLVKVDSARVQYWLGVGAKPTDSVQRLLVLTGDWAKFTGEGNEEGSLEVAAPRVPQSEVYAKAVDEAANAPDAPVRTLKPASVDTAVKAAEGVTEAAEKVVDAAASDEAAKVEAAADATDKA